MSSGSRARACKGGYMMEIVDVRCFCRVGLNVLKGLVCSAA